MKGIILAGGNGTRLYLLTLAVSKQLIPVYDKSMIYYPLTTLILAGINGILIITTPHDKEAFIRLLGDGNQWGVSISYAVQPSPDGLAQAFIIGEEFISNNKCALFLGDNIFFGYQLSTLLQKAKNNKTGTIGFAYPVSEPKHYGVVEFDAERRVVSLEEKPKSHFAVTGIYFYDNDMVKIAKNIKPSERGKLEITTVNNAYLERGDLQVKLLGRGMAWLDTGTHDSLTEANVFVQTIEKRQGLKVISPKKIAWRMGWISDNQFEEVTTPLIKSGYGRYLHSLVEEGK